MQWESFNSAPLAYENLSFLSFTALFNYSVSLVFVGNIYEILFSLLYNIEAEGSSHYNDVKWAQ